MAAMALNRVLEPEVMDSEEEAREYDAMDHGAVNSLFCRDLLAHWPDLRRTLDVGTGTARIVIELCRRARETRAVAVDLAPSMLRLGARNVELAGLSGVISLELCDAQKLGFAAGVFGCVLSNSLIHHVPDPRGPLREMRRVLAPGGLLFVRDLFRPNDDEAVRALVTRYAKTETPDQRALFEASLRAAFTVQEMKDIAADAGIDPSAVEATSDRHFTIAYRAN
jgi:ubiquinone/menaquinone biosynthesis C-methylase UbiE